MKVHYYTISCENEICYVGSTTKTLNTRWAQYRNGHNNPTYRGHYTSPICTYMREKGFDKFTHELLETLDIDPSDRYLYEGGWQETLRNAGYELKNVVTAGNSSGPRLESIHYHNDQKRKLEKVTCDICGTQVCRSGIARHKKEVHGPKFPCDICGQLMVKNSIKRHQQRWHKT